MLAFLATTESCRSVQLPSKVMWSFGIKLIVLSVLLFIYFPWAGRTSLNNWGPFHNCFMHVYITVAHSNLNIILFVGMDRCLQELFQVSIR